MNRRHVGGAVRHSARQRRDMLHVAWLAALATGATIAGAVPSTAVADELRMEPRSERSLATPPRGMTMERVRANFGRPKDQRAAVGDPPITRWEYDGFVVYFEYQYVLHSVVKRGS